MRRFFKFLLIVLSVLYPLAVFTAVHVYHASPRTLAFCLLAMGTVFFLANGRNAGKGDIQAVVFWGTVAIIIGLSVVVFVTESIGLVKLYPVLINAVLLASFGYTLLKPPTMIFRFAALQDRSIPSSPDRAKIEAYTRRVTQVWCCFFVSNALAAAYTAFFASQAVWAIYNGLVSYALIGLLMIVELLVRKARMAR
jgi:uncharacterized membrane protein